MFILRYASAQAKRGQVFCGIGAIVVFSLVLAISGCGGGSNTATTTAGSANVTINTGDATNDQVLAFELTINTLTLTGKDTGGNASNPSVLSKPTEVEFEHEAAAFEPLTLANLPPGTYTSASITVSNPEVVAVISGVPTKLTAVLSSSSVTVNFSSPITITSSNSTVINFDLDLANSLSISGTNATVTPTFKVTTATVNANNEGNEGDDNGEIEDVHGSVSAVAANANPPAFTITTSSGMSLTFSVNSNTQFEGVSGLSQLAMGAVVEVDGQTQQDGSKLASKVEVEENDGAQGEEAEGIITSVGGTAPNDSLSVAAQVEMMSGNTSSVVGNSFTVNTSSNTKFVVRADKLDLGSTPAFDAGNIGVGQRIEADTGSGSMSNGATITADTVKLREQALIGTVAASPAPTSSGFTLTLNSTSAFGNLTGVTSVPVSIVSGTELRNGASITPGATVRVRGLIFFNSGAYSMIAVRIDNND